MSVFHCDFMEFIRNKMREFILVSSVFRFLFWLQRCGNRLDRDRAAPQLGSTESTSCGCGRIDISTFRIPIFDIYRTLFLIFGAVDVLVGVEGMKCCANTDRNSCTSWGNKKKNATHFENLGARRAQTAL